MKRLMLASLVVVGASIVRADYTHDGFNRVFTHVFRAADETNPFDYGTLGNWFKMNDDGATWTALSSEGTTVIPGAPSSNLYGPILVDGALFERALDDANAFYDVMYDGTLEGWTLRLGVANRVRLKVATIKKLQADTAADLRIDVDETSKLTVGQLGTESRLRGLNLSVASPEGLTVEQAVNKNHDGVDFGFHYHLARRGSVNYSGGLSVARKHTVESVELEMGSVGNGDTKRVERKLIAFSSQTDQTFGFREAGVTATADVTPQAKAGGCLSVEDDPVGTYRFETRADGYYVLYVAYADAPDYISAEYVWSGTESADWANAANWTLADGTAATAAPQLLGGGNYQPILIKGTKSSPATVTAEAALEGWNFNLTLSRADVTIKNLSKFQSSTSLVLKDGSRLKLACNGGSANNWALNKLDIEDGSLFELTNAGRQDSGTGAWAFNVDTHRAGRFHFAEGWTSAKEGTISFDLNIGRPTQGKTLKTRVIGTWGEGKTCNLTFAVGSVIGGTGAEPALTAEMTSVSAFPAGAYRFVKDDDARQYVVRYVDYDPSAFPLACVQLDFADADAPFANTGYDASIVANAANQDQFTRVAADAESPVLDCNGRRRTALSKGNNTAVVTIPLSAVKVMGSTISFWATRPVGDSWKDCFGVQYNLNGMVRNQVWERNNEGNVSIYYLDGGPASDQNLASCIAAVSDDRLHHWAVVTDASGQTIYLDGVRLNESPILPFTLSPTGDDTFSSLCIGGLPSRNRGAAASFADVRVYDRALSAEQVAEVFATDGRARRKGFALFIR